MYQNGFIKLHRKLLNWEWYSDGPVFRLFINLLLTVNYETKRWRGQEIKRGQRITSVSALASETGLSEKQVRRAIELLASTNDIGVETTNRYTKITVIKYDDYQGFPNKDEGEQRTRLKAHHKAINCTSGSQGGQTNRTPDGRQGSSTKEYKRKKRKNKDDSSVFWGC